MRKLAFVLFIMIQFVFPDSLLGEDLEDKWTARQLYLDDLEMGCENVKLFLREP
jgi:hypothetical protein